MPDKKFTRRVALMEGGDWNDAGVFHIRIGDGVDLDEWNHKWHEWYRNVYCPNIKTEKYLNLGEFLIANAVAEQDDEIEEYW